MKNKLSINHFQDLKQIGHGAFGKVYQATFKTTGKSVALKKISKKQIKNNNMMTQISNQIQISKKLQHPNIVKLYDYFDQDNDIFLVLQLASGGQLYSKLMRYGRFDQSQTKRMIKQIISAVKYLHENKIIHRDIKPENILLDKKGNVKLADFGWSNFSDKPRKTYCGTVDYLAPEMIDKSGHDQSLDIWCLGVLVFELLTGKTPFVSENAKGPEKKKIIQQNILNMNINFPNDFPILAKGFVLGMIKRNPKQRLTQQQIQNHQWLIQKPNIQQKQQQLTPTNYPDKSQKQFTFTTTDSSSHQSKQHLIIQSLKKRIKQLQQQLSILSQNTQLKKQFKSQYSDQQISTMIKQIRKLKPLQHKLTTLEKDYNQCWEKMNQKDKEIILLKSEIKKNNDIKEQCDLLKIKEKKYQEKIKKIEKELVEMKNKQIKLTEQLQEISSNISTKVKYGAKLTNFDVTSPQFVAYIEEELGNLGKNFEQSKKVLLKVLQKQKISKQNQQQLGRLRSQQKNLKQILKSQLKQQFEHQKDQILINARKQLTEQRQRWMLQRQRLKKIYEQSSNNPISSDFHKDSGKQADLQLELQTIKQINSCYEKTISEQNFRIKDLQSQLKRKK